MLISLRMSLLCTLIVALSGCLPVTIVGGVIGISDSIGKNRRMDRIELRIDALEKAKQDRADAFIKQSRAVEARLGG